MQQTPARPVHPRVDRRGSYPSVGVHGPRQEARRGSRIPSGEAAAFHGIVDPALLEAAARRARDLGVGIDEVLRCHNILSPEQIAAALARRLGLAIDPLDEALPPLSVQLACCGVLARSSAGDYASITLGPRGDGVQRLEEMVAREPRLKQRLRMAAPERLAEHVRLVSAAELAHEAVCGLHERRQDLSALPYRARRLRLAVACLGLAAFAAGGYAYGLLLIAIEYLLAFCFITWSLLRAASCLFPRQDVRTERIPERHLPIYTIILPLLREERVVADLIAAIRRLDYPPEKLDVKLMLEEDDHGTRAAVAALRLGAPFEVIAPPPGEPRTKPKALAAALPFARGSFVVVYDAEDEPEPDQLRSALAAFAADPTLACVQARLAVYNGKDGWFARHFTSEYAGQFDVLLPALARLRLPIPLGGTSNHFRIEALRQAGGWDPFNVTEDADLGMRLARFGYRVGAIPSTTWEEAPVAYRQWLHQRTRWFKGWMQTWGVHMRHPLRLYRELGLRGFMAMQLLVGGTVLSAMVHPFFMLLVLWNIASGEFFAAGETYEESFRKGLAVSVLTVGYVGSAALGIVGLARRKMLGVAPVLLSMPGYWFLLSIAAWRAFFHFFKARYQWEKTEHGLARSSSRPPAHAASGRSHRRKTMDGRRRRF